MLFTPDEIVGWCERWRVNPAATHRGERFPLPPVARAYLTILDEHLSARHWEELKLDDTRARMRELIDGALNREMAA